jgi:hypothetical protein
MLVGVKLMAALVQAVSAEVVKSGCTSTTTSVVLIESTHPPFVTINDAV